MIELEFDKGDVARINRAYDNLMAFPKRDFMEGLVDLTMQQSLDRFDTKRDPDGAPWKPWSDSYKKSGAPFHGRHSLLQLSGDMRESISGQASSGKRGEVTYDEPYAAAQNEQRTFLGFISDDPEAEAFGLRYLEREVA